MAKRTPGRPAGVPAEAVWSHDDGEWQLGATRRRGWGRSNVHPVGEQRAWRADGSLRGLAHFDDDGALHGTNERFHPDGTLASRGEWSHGSRHGRFVFIQCEGETDESYPTSDATWRYEMESFANWEERNERWFLKDGRRCTSDGRPLDEAYDLEDTLRDVSPDGYLATAGARVASAIRREPVTGREDPHALAGLWGQAFPEIDRLLACLLEGDHFTPEVEPRPLTGNVWESLIAHPWHNRFEELGAVLLGAVRIGSLGDSDGVYATLFQPMREKPGPNVVYLWSHDTDYVDDVIASSLDAFAFRNAVAAAAAAERLSPATARAAWRKLAGLTHVSWGLDAGLSEPEADEADGGAEPVDEPEAAGPTRADFQVELDATHEARSFFWRAQWIAQLLAPDADRRWDVVRECFRPKRNPSLDDAAHARWIERGRVLPPVAFYLLWRAFWFEETDRLARAKDAFRAHPARLVRDLVALLEEVERGRKALGGIADLLEVRRRFRELDLRPEREAERAREAESARVAEEERASRAVALVESSLPASADLEEVLDLAWKNVQDPAGLGAAERAARRLPGLADVWRAHDWARDLGYERGDVTCLEEAEAVGLWLSENGGRALLPFLWSPVLRGEARGAAGLLPFIVTSPASREDRLAGACLALLDDESDPYNIRRALAVRLLGVMEHRDAVPRLASLVRGALDSVDAQDRIAQIPWEDLLRETATTLGRLVAGDGSTGASASEPRSDSISGVADAAASAGLEALHALLERGLASRDERLAAAALLALVACCRRGVGAPDRLLPAVERLLSIATDDAGRHAALRAVESLAASFDPEGRAWFAAVVFRNPADHENATTLLYERAAAALLDADPSLPLERLSPAEMLQATAELSNYGDGWALWRLSLCETVGRFPELPLARIEPYLRAGDRTLRQAAEDAFRARGVEPPPRTALTWPVIWRALEEGEPGAAASRVARLLVAPTSVDRAVAAGWFWQNPSPAGAAALATVLDAALDHLEPVGHGESLPKELYWLLRALMKHAAFDGAAATVERLLAFEGEEVARTVLAELESVPARFAVPIAAQAARQTDWRRRTAAQWLLSRMADPAVEAALRAAGLDARKLKRLSS